MLTKQQKDNSFVAPIDRKEQIANKISKILDEEGFEFKISQQVILVPKQNENIPNQTTPKETKQEG